MARITNKVQVTGEVQIAECPKCGNDAVTLTKDSLYGTMYKLECPNCKHAAGPWRYLKDAAIAEWNKLAKSNGGDSNGT